MTRLVGVREREGAVARIEVNLLHRVGASRWRAATKHDSRLAPGDRVFFGVESANVCVLASLDALVETKDERGEIVLAFDLAGPALDEAIAAHASP